MLTLASEMRSEILATWQSPLGEKAFTSPVQRILSIEEMLLFIGI